MPKNQEAMKKSASDQQAQLKAQAEKAIAEKNFIAKMNRSGFTNCKATPQTSPTWTKLKNALIPQKLQKNQPKPEPKYDFDLKSTSDNKEDEYTHHARTDTDGNLNSLHIDKKLADKHDLSDNDKKEISKIATTAKENFGDDTKFTGSFSTAFVEEMTNEKNGFSMEAFKDADIKDEKGKEFTVSAKKDNSNQFELTPKPEKSSAKDDKNEAEKEKSSAPTPN